MTEPCLLRRWDVVCRVVDHYGDAGVCLRLARALAAAPGRDVRLLADRPDVVLALIQPRPTEHAADRTWRDRSGVTIAGWDAPGRAVDVVVETFGGDLPPALHAGLHTQRQAGDRDPVWINLDHLSAEAWVESCHGLPSPQSGGLTRWFMFPGFTANTAGLLGPPAALPDLPPALARMASASGAAMHRDSGEWLGSVFCYAGPRLPALLDAIEQGSQPVRLLVPDGMPGDLGARPLCATPGARWQRGCLTLVRIPFVDQDVYDTLLAACDLNLVRGEDSFVRAQWAGRPLLWHAYPQSAGAQADKVAAWTDRAQLPPAWAALTAWFNGVETIDSAPMSAEYAVKPQIVGTTVTAAELWRRAVEARPQAQAWALAWREQMRGLPRVEHSLAAFAACRASALE